MAGVGVRVGRCRGRRCRGAESPVLRPHTSVATLHASAATPLRPTGDGSCQIPSLKVQSEPTQLGFQRGILTSQHRRWLNRLIHRVDSPGACDPTRPWQRAPLLGGGTPTDLGSGPLRPTGGEPCQIPSPKVQSEPTQLGFQRGNLTPITGRTPRKPKPTRPRVEDEPVFACRKGLPRNSGKSQREGPISTRWTMWESLASHRLVAESYRGN